MLPPGTIWPLLARGPDGTAYELDSAVTFNDTITNTETGETVTELYPFEAPRCDRVVFGVLRQLTEGGGPPTSGDA